MNGVSLLLILATVGISPIWRQDREQSVLEYCIQVDTATRDRMASGYPLSSELQQDEAGIHRFCLRLQGPNEKPIENLSTTYDLPEMTTAEFLRLRNPNTYQEPALILRGTKKSEPLSGITHGWQADSTGGVIYTIQLSPDRFKSLQAQDELFTPIHPDAGPIRRFEVIVGNTNLVRQNGFTGSNSLANVYGPGSTAGGYNGGNTLNPQQYSSTLPNSNWENENGLLYMPWSSDTRPSNNTRPRNTGIVGNSRPAIGSTRGNNNLATGGSMYNGERDYDSRPVSSFSSDLTQPPVGSNTSIGQPVGQNAYGSNYANNNLGNNNGSNFNNYADSNPGRSFGNRNETPGSITSQKPNDGGFGAGNSNFVGGNGTSLNANSSDRMASNPSPNIRPAGIGGVNRPINNTSANGDGSTVPNIRQDSWQNFLLMMVCALFLSIGGNLYLGWTAAEFYSRYRTAIDRMRGGR